ncbi:MAG: hypothetical protein Q7T34_00405 [Candidatus Parcubacteria bacterium]|nr:hypothetical protein [Candidatus Parcubacteria bacterium]
MPIIKILKIIGKNILIFIGGAVFGVIMLLIFIFPRAIESLSNKDPLAGIVLIPLILIIYGSISIIGGGLGAVIVFNIIKKIKKRRKSVKTTINK